MPVENGMPAAPRVVGVDAVDDIAALCARAVARPLAVTELRDTLFAPDQPAIVRLAPGAGVVAVVRSEREGYIRLLAVDPAHRRRGLGHILVHAAEEDLADLPVVTVGADPPYFLFPGVPTTESGLCHLLERHHYVREETNYNVDVDLHTLVDGPAEGTEPDPQDREEVALWADRHWPNWLAEFMRAFDRGSLIMLRDGRGIAAMCAFDVNRAATLGPIASRPDLIGTGFARPLLLATLHRMRDKGYGHVEVLWVGPFVPYSRVGGKIGALFFVYRKRR
jgi:mycothiol synthase